MNLQDTIANLLKLPTPSSVAAIQDALAESQTENNHLFLMKLKLSKTIHELSQENESLASALVSVKKELQNAQQQILSQGPSATEIYWNTKRPTTNHFKYPCRTIHAMPQNNLYAVDPRIFLLARGSELPSINDTHDKIALEALRFVKNRVTYTADKDPLEFWQLPFETMNRRLADCDDGALLMAAIMLHNGIPAYKVRVNAGNVQDPNDSTKKLGHAFVTYLKEDDGTEHGTWFVLDWCYWPKESLNFALPWKQAEGKYFDVWWSFSEKNIYAKDMLDRV